MDCTPDSRRPYTLGREGSLLQNNPGRLVSGGRCRRLVMLVSNALSQRGGSSSLLFLTPLFSLVDIQYVKVDEGLGCLMEVTSFIYSLKFSGPRVAPWVGMDNVFLGGITNCCVHEELGTG